jgi:dihydroorotate dehydrogenase subfamily 2
MRYRDVAIGSIAASYQHVLKPVFFRVQPELVHERMTDAGEFLSKSALVRSILGNIFTIRSPVLSQYVAGLTFANPIGLSAGFDYEAKLTQILPALGFGFGTVGTITNMAYEGNPPPMLGRLPKSRSLLVNKGFKNNGSLAVLGKLSNHHFSIPLGISIGRTNTPYLDTVKKSIRDILDAFETFESPQMHHRFYELNISCPNVGMASGMFYEPGQLDLLLQELDSLRLKKPVFVKMPIEKEDKVVLALLEIIAKHRIAGVIFGNLQKNRNDTALYQDEVRKFSKGNFSGKPTYRRSNELIALGYRHFGKQLLIIGCGGVFSGNDAYEKILLGASLVQLITGMIFQGPQLIAEINSGIIQLLERDGFGNISEAVGKGLKI